MKNKKSRVEMIINSVNAFVNNYKTSTNEKEQLQTDREFKFFIDGVEKNEKLNNFYTDLYKGLK